jgi:hypothetical protein
MVNYIRLVKERWRVRMRVVMDMEMNFMVPFRLCNDLLYGVS